MTEWDDLPRILTSAPSFLAATYGMSSDMSVTLLGLSENVSLLITDSQTNREVVLRVHRRAYHNRHAIASELGWLAALHRDTDLLVPRSIDNAAGAQVSEMVLPDGRRRHSVLFDRVPGTNLTLEDASPHWYNKLGKVAAELHNHTTRWPLPDGFQRFAWDIESTLGPTARFGSWRDHPGLSWDAALALDRAESLLRNRLDSYQAQGGQQGLIHGDLHLMNLMIDGDDLWSIDFDDCGFSWLMFDIGASMQFVPDGPFIEELTEAWTTGYQQVRPLAQMDIDFLTDFIFLRRLLLLGWSATHVDATLPEAMSDIVQRTTEAACRYLRS